MVATHSSVESGEPIAQSKVSSKLYILRDLGELIHRWHDKWLPQPLDFKPITPPVLLASEAMVADLIDRDSRSWWTDLITQIFDPEDAQVISNIPIGDVNRQDTLIWHYSKDG
ncbi:UNVERIFIED_CONTAM: hypothetical protein Scaly_2208000 [Sesamum calycinum]|uniref:Uncharacterized protein n=1 Tax=Sesamum calycinum TaxID=2727403 RepID=A0AAW2MPF1_9LAMI